MAIQDGIMQDELHLGNAVTMVLSFPHDFASGHFTASN